LLVANSVNAPTTPINKTFLFLKKSLVLMKSFGAGEVVFISIGGFGVAVDANLAKKLGPPTTPCWIELRDDANTWVPLRNTMLAMRK